MYLGLMQYLRLLNFYKLNEIIIAWPKYEEDANDLTVWDEKWDASVSLDNEFTDYLK